MAFGRSFITMFNRFLEQTIGVIQERPEEKLLWFTWSNESKGRVGIKFYIDLKKSEEGFVLEMGVPGDEKGMTLDFHTVSSKKFIFLRRKNYNQEKHCIEGSGVLWFFRVDGNSVSFVSNPFRKAIDKNSWVVDFLNRIQRGDKRPIEVQLSFNNGLSDEWKSSFRNALATLLPRDGKDEDNDPYWIRNLQDGTEDSTEGLMAGLENHFGTNNDPVARDMGMVFFVSLILRWFTFAVDDDPIPGFPKSDDMHNVRPVDLNPYDVNAELKDKGFSYPYQVIIAACSALNAGKHLILSGPPGNGKTELAIQLSKMAGVNLITATANPSWTAAELMGRYMPKEKGGLEFVPGYFLTAIENSNDKKWLLIDEFNRADIDTCMGELFTILSNQAVVLPFRANDDSEGSEVAETDSAIAKRIAVIPATVGDSGRSDTEQKDDDAKEKPHRQFDASLYKTYVVPPEFRIIATMNDSDASRLNPLSFALRRRFVTLRVEAPLLDKRIELIEKRLNKIIKFEEKERSFYGVKNHKLTAIAEKFEEVVQDLLFDLFASNVDIGRDLLDMRLIGVGQVLDMIDFIKEGLRAPNAGIASVENDKLEFSTSKKAEDSSPGKKSDRIGQLIASYAALAVEMMVFPQFDACDDSNFKSAVNLVAKAFADYDFLVVNAPDKESDSKQSGSYYSVNSPERYPTINHYLGDKLRSQYSYQPDRLGTVELVFGKEE